MKPVWGQVRPDTGTCKIEVSIEPQNIEVIQFMNVLLSGRNEISLLHILRHPQHLTVMTCWSTDTWPYMGVCIPHPHIACQNFKTICHHIHLFKFDCNDWLPSICDLKTASWKASSLCQDSNLMCLACSLTWSQAWPLIDSITRECTETRLWEV